jgi:TetR/AcrR family transcriptional regulator, cholesterol catabolism regulator
MTYKSKRFRTEQLVEQATELFSKSGYRETGMQQIADALGITRPLFYYYFDSKEDLLWSIIGHLGDELYAQAQPIASSEAGPAEKLRRILEAHAETLLSNMDPFRIYFAERHEVTAKRDVLLRKGEDAYIALITDVIYEGQQIGVFRSDRPGVLTMLVTGMGNSMLRWFQASGLITPVEMKELFADVGLSAILARG